MSIRAALARLLLVLAALAAWHVPAHARVEVTFHSISGSFLSGRYPHAFVAFDGRLDDTGEVVHSNYGFSARSAGPGGLRVDYPSSMLRHPKAWLNHVAELNPQLHARPIA